MNKVRYYTDEHVSRAVIRGLRQRGVNVLSVPETGMRGASDEAHLTRANAEGRVVFTQDADFLRLAAASFSITESSALCRAHRLARSSVASC